MSSYYEKHKNDPQQVAALIHFKEGVSIERVQEWVRKLTEAGFIDGSTVREYIPALGEPVWYIP